MNNNIVCGLGALATATAVVMPLATIGGSNCVENFTFYRNFENPVNFTCKYEQGNCTAKQDLNINGYDIDAFYFIETNFNVSADDRDYVRNFVRATGNLMELKRNICEKFGDVSVELEPFVDGDIKYLTVNIRCNNNEDLDELLNNLQLVSIAWFSSTKIDVSKYILIDLVV